MAAVQPVTSFATEPRLLLHLFCVAQPYSSILIDLSRPFWEDFNIRLKCPPLPSFVRGITRKGIPLSLPRGPSASASSLQGLTREEAKRQWKKGPT